MSPHPLTNFEIQKYDQNEQRFNDVCSRNNLSIKIKDWVYVINLNEYADVGTHWIALFCKRSEMVYLIVLVLNMFLKKLKNLLDIKNIEGNIFRVQTNYSVMCGCLCIGFIDFVLAGKRLTNVTSLFFPYDFKKNDNIVLGYFKDE